MAHCHRHGARPREALAASVVPPPAVPFPSTACPCCPTDQTLFANASGIQRRHRNARKDELERRVNQSNIVFSLAGNKSIGRTNKHKRHAWCPDSGANVSVTNRLDIFLKPLNRICPMFMYKLLTNHVFKYSLLGQYLEYES